MSEHTPPPAGDEAMDREISIKGVAWTGLGLALTIAVSMVVAWWIAKGLKDLTIEGDPEPPPIAEALERRLPPGPRLQGAPGSAFESRGGAPELELRQLRADEQRWLEGYEWVDRRQGLVRIPVERAMELVAEHGLPDFAGAPAPTAATHDHDEHGASPDAETADPPPPAAAPPPPASAADGGSS